MATMRAAWTAVVALAASCAAEPSTPPPGVTLLTPVEHLTRASLALRGVRPALDELREVAADPDRLDDLVDAYLETPEFGATIRDLHNETLLLLIQQDNYTIPSLGPLQDRTFEEMASSIFQEPLRLIEDVVMSDRPYTEIVTADYTMADKIVATVWGMAHSGNDRWERAAWPDGRPAAGILASTAFHLRYRSTNFNYNRGRAAAVSRALLCHDFLEADIPVDTSVDLSDPSAVTRAVTSNPACAGCHQTLDPLASYFFAFHEGTLFSAPLVGYPVTHLYDADDTDRWFLTNRRPPSYFGQPAEGLAGLGQAIADDPRFARCAAIRFASYLTETPARELPRAWVDELAADLASSKFSAKQLARSIVLSDAFRSGAATDPALAEGIVGYQKLRPAQLQRMLQALTGFVWRSQSRELVRGLVVGTFDYLDDDHMGFRVLGGGIDSFYVTRPVHTMTATASLVVRRAAFEAAKFVVAHDAAAPPGERTLLADGIPTDPARVRAQLALLHARIYGELVDPGDAAVDATAALVDGALHTSRGDASRAWIITLTGMLSDLRAVYY